MERDPDRARAAAGVFVDQPRVQVRTGDWRDLKDAGPFDLLMLDDSSQGKGGEPPDPEKWLRPYGLVVLDDYVPMTSWPPTDHGQPDLARMHWLNHPKLRAAEVRVTPGAATVIATYLG